MLCLRIIIIMSSFSSLFVHEKPHPISDQKAKPCQYQTKIAKCITHVQTIKQLNNHTLPPFGQHMYNNFIIHVPPALKGSNTFPIPFYKKSFAITKLLNLHM